MRQDHDDITGADGVSEGDLDLPTLTGFVWDVSSFATDGTVMVVPEPSRALLLVLGLTAILLRRRRGAVRFRI